MTAKELTSISLSYSLLYVEDDEGLANVCTIYFKNIFKEVICKKNGKEGLEEYKRRPFDLVITDIEMPIMNGLEMSKAIKELNKDQNILVISAYSDSYKFIESIKIGIDGYILKPIDFTLLHEMLYKTINKIKISQEHLLYKVELEKLLQIKTHENNLLEEEKNNNFEKTLFALVNMLESRDIYTGKHSLRVAQYAKLIAQQFGYTQEECEEIYKAGILHDIGKVAIPDAILLKPTSLTQEEHDLIKEHVDFGYKVLREIPMFKNIASIIYGHHERMDGSGYPLGLKGDEISDKSLILGIADSFDAMTTNRIYKHSKTISQALCELESLKEIHFSSNIVDVAKKVLKHISIEQNIHQNPITYLEQERFSYFYKDYLTGIYNEQYLDFILNNIFVEKKKAFIKVILLNNFSQYNKSFGWQQGNDLLRKIANILTHTYPENLIFRIHGDDFVIITEKHTTFKRTELKEISKLLNNTNITASSQEYDLKEKEIIVKQFLLTCN